jgi:triosephosphate isomerase (TIM)
MRRPIVAGNWKMNLTAAEGTELASALKPIVADVDGVDIVVCPTYTTISAVSDAVSGSNVSVGAQNMYWEDNGAFTGEIAPEMLLTSGCTYVIIGHSERRLYFGETNETVNNKVKKALEVGLTPIMCVGETLEERESDKTEDVIRDHVEGGLAGLSAAEIGKIVLAYEPVWAIGTGMTASPNQAQEVHAFIRGLLTDLSDASTAQSVRIQYGGSMKPENAGELIGKPDIDGGLIGGAALKADSFAGIIKAAL